MPSGLISTKPPLPIKGVKFSAVNAGIYKNKSRDDLVLIELCEASNTAAVFTKNAFCAAPVIVAKSHLNLCQPKYLLINAGNANAGTGKPGIDDAKKCCESLAALTGCSSSSILPFSTGVIGEKLPVERIENSLGELVNSLDGKSVNLAAEAIKTTDTVAKIFSKEIFINGEAVSITGIAKGSGMIRPDMATMLSYVFTDAKINKSFLEKLLSDLVEQSFHRITVDSDTSTNDACVFVATGQSSVVISEENIDDVQEFYQALQETFIFLAQAIVRDGEGATKFITININKADTLSEALDVAFNIAHSPLVKTALFASDPNWGRVLAVVGRSRINNLDISKVDIALDDVDVITGGGLNQDYTEVQGAKVMQKDEISINVNLNRGDICTSIWTSDLSYDYVKINAEYRT